MTTQICRIIVHTPTPAEALFHRHLRETVKRISEVLGATPFQTLPGAGAKKKIRPTEKSSRPALANAAPTEKKRMINACLN